MAVHKKIATLLIFMTCFAMVESYYSGNYRSRNYRSDLVPENELRQEITKLIEENPGIYFRCTIRSTNRTVGVIQYHLNWLTNNGKIVSFDVAGYKGYFMASMGKLSEKKKRALLFLRVQHKGAILSLLVRRGSINTQELAEILQLSNQNLSYHLKLLEKNELITRKRDGLGKLISIDPELQQFLLPYLEVPQIILF